MSTAEFLAKIKNGAIRGWHEYQILPSITGAQGILEGASGTSALAQPPYNNQFGIKASPDWTGRTVVMPTREWVNGQYITVDATFRAYDSIDDSVADHAAFFTNTPWRVNNYRHVVGETDYKKAAWALQNAGYATDPQYANKLIQRIEANNLQEWDKEALSSVPASGSKEIVTGTLNQSGKDYIKHLAVTVIGDSLGVGTEPHFKQLVTNSNFFVRGSRQLTHVSSYDLDATRVARDNLSRFANNVVVILGTNAGLSTTDVNNFISMMGNRNIFWVNTASKGVINQSRRDNVTNEIRKASVKYSNVYLLDWDKASASNWSSYYGSDQVHMNSTGYARHADFIGSAIYQVLNSSGKEAPATPSEIPRPNVRDETYIGIEGIEYDDGRYYTLLGESSIQDREANERFGRNQSSTFGWITRPFQSNETDVKKLFNEALESLKSYSEPKITYTVPVNYLPEGIDVDDWVDIVDHHFKPPLYLQAQVYEIIESETYPESEKIILHNFKEVDSGIPEQLLNLQNSLEHIERTVFDDLSMVMTIESSEGLIFSNDNTETLLTARIMQFGQDRTNHADEFKWWRRSDVLSGEDETWEAENSPSITISGNDFEHSATYICTALREGKIIAEAGVTLRKVIYKDAYQLWLEAGNEGTMEDFLKSIIEDSDIIIDGQTTYFHIAWANDPMGEDFSLTESLDKKYMGVYSSLIETPSEDWRDYQWTKLTEAFAEEIRDELNNKADQVELDGAQQTIREVIETIKAVNTRVDLTTENYLITHTDEIITTIETLLSSSEDADRRITVTEQIKEIVDTYFKFDSKMTIGKSNSKLKLMLDNERVEFVDNNTVLAWLSGYSFNAQNIVVHNTFRLPNHIFEPLGNLTILRPIHRATVEPKTTDVIIEVDKKYKEA